MVLQGATRCYNVLHVVDIVLQGVTLWYAMVLQHVTGCYMVLKSVTCHYMVF